MKRNFAPAVLVLLLGLLHLQLNATTVRKWIAAVREDRTPVFFADASSSSGSSKQPLLKPQTQTQTQPQTQSQSQTQTQKLYIGFPMMEGWKFHTDSPVIAQPQTDETAVYCASKQGIISGVNQSDGEQIWRTNVSDNVEEAFLLKQDTLFVGTQRGFLVGIERKTGKKLWTQKVENESFLTMPAVDDARVYFQGAHGAIVCLNQKTGALIWRFQTGGTSNTTPFIKDGLVFSGSDDHHIYAIDSNAGFLRWKFNTSAAVKGSPIASSKYVFAGNEDGFFFCLNLSNGSERWQVKTGGAIRGVPAFYYHKDETEPDEVLFSAFDNFLYDLKIKNGNRIWLSPTSSRVYNRMHFDRALFFVTPFGASVFGVDPHTGTRVGDYGTKTRIRSSPITANDRLFIGLNNGTLLSLTRQPPPPPEGEEGEQTQTSAQSQLEPEEAPAQSQPQGLQTQTQSQTQSQTQ